ncbi:hypothetical protein CCP4SC76_6550003 [Gammaproteobacteria bacterium]
MLARLENSFRYQFEVVSQFSAEKQTVRELLEGLILKQAIRRWDTRHEAAAAPPMKTVTGKQ